MNCVKTVRFQAPLLATRTQIERLTERYNYPRLN